MTLYQQLDLYIYFDPHWSLSRVKWNYDSVQILQDITNKSAQRVYNSFEKCLNPLTPSSPVQLSKPYQFMITMSEIIPENIKSVELKTPPQSCAQEILGQDTNDDIL